VYEYQAAYDDHRRVNALTNRLDAPGRGVETLAAYGFTHDGNGNPLTQTANGRPDFAADDRDFTVDRLNRLTDTDYLETGAAESTSFDLVGNREAHRNRKGETTYYGVVNAANEFPWIGAWHNGSPRRKKQRASGGSRAEATFWKRVGGQPFEPTSSARSATRRANRPTEPGTAAEGEPGAGVWAADGSGDESRVVRSRAREERLRVRRGPSSPSPAAPDADDPLGPDCGGLETACGAAG